MDGNEISERLRALATDDKRRSETARLRDVFDDVEAALRAGVAQADVLSELHQAGFTMTMASFKSALQRIRKQRATTENASPKAVAKASGVGGSAPAKPIGTGKLEIPKLRTFEHNPAPEKDDLL